MLPAPHLPLYPRQMAPKLKPIWFLYMCVSSDKEKWKPIIKKYSTYVIIYVVFIIIISF